MYQKLLIPDIINMHRNNVRANSCFHKAVEYQLKNPNLTIHDTKLADFSLRKQEDKSKYMMVVCLLNKTKKDNFVTPPAQQSITMSRSNREPNSSITMSADSIVTCCAPAKKAKIPHSTATAMQLRCVAALEKKNKYKTAFKCATVVFVYAWEKGKGDDMSARTVAELIRNDCGISLSPNDTKEGEGRQNWIFATEAWSKRQHPRAALQQPLCGI